MKIMAPSSIATALLSATVAAAAQPATPPQSGQAMQGTNCDQMMGQQMAGMMASGGMHAGMTVGWIVGTLVGLAAIFALVALGIYLLRHSRTAAPPAKTPTETSPAHLRDVRAST
jgi:hypothetical protein